jgi:hypothetical protein
LYLLKNNAATTFFDPASPVSIWELIAPFDFGGGNMTSERDPVFNIQENTFVVKPPEPLLKLDKAPEGPKEKPGEAKQIMPQRTIEVPFNLSQ